MIEYSAKNFGFCNESNCELTDLLSFDIASKIKCEKSLSVKIRTMEYRPEDGFSAQASNKFHSAFNNNLLPDAVLKSADGFNLWFIQASDVVFVGINFPESKSSSFPFILRNRNGEFEAVEYRDAFDSYNQAKLYEKLSLAHNSLMQIDFAALRSSREKKILDENVDLASSNKHKIKL